MLNKKVLTVVISAALGLTACNGDDEIVYVDTPVETSLSSTAAEGKTLSNTPDVVVKSAIQDIDEVTITIAATSDLHGRLFGYDYAIDGEDKDAGLTRIATLLKQEKAKNSNMILIDIGDTVQGNSAQLFNDNPTHPVVSTLNALDYDLWVPGNHEFNFDREFVDRNLAHFNGAVVSNNIKWEASNTNYIRSFQVFEVDGAKVAIVGLTPSNIPNWEASAPEHFKGLKFDEELASTQAAVAQLVEEYQPDVIVGAFHLSRNSGGTGVYDVAAAMADQFDVILAGHEHATYIESITKGEVGEDVVTKDISAESNHATEDKTLAGVYDESNRANSVKIIEPGKWGSALAKADIKLKKNDAGKWEMVDTTLANISTYGVEQDVDISAQFQYVDDMAKADAQEVIGKVVGVFTPGSGADEAVHEDLNNEVGRLYTTIHTAKVQDTPLMDFINTIQLQKSGADISAASLFSDGSNLIDDQDYAKKDSTRLYKYDNTLIGIDITGENLKRYMEWSYSYFNPYQDGDITVSFRKGAKSYNYDQFDGNIKFVVDLTGDAFAQTKGDDGKYQVTNEGSRINISEINGEPFDPAATYKLAVNSYRYGSQLKMYGWVSASGEDKFYDSVNENVYAIRDMLTEYIITNKSVNAADYTNNNWEFKQYQTNGAITLARTDNGAGQALWTQLVNKEICVKIDPENPKYPGILYSVNVDDATSYFANPNKDSADQDEVYQGCVEAQ
ncbi:2',3'-cyclic-nucleotide 2'-phosphodiesterase [Shewanella algicola]|uniref:5'-nucleotidase C-terminal domain-containing protein n=1 Tax=Shewanella algicola TaxID=640633 RepID=A0A9X1Z7G8_9GAMM|nr:5'-nucleotidase C-terminal domain-containing protein [Shewanella algicola]MCL1107160.1 5'-nucleotidase C-terminal domain-containing protein [Shewanella algicola]GGP65765.1 2',3'-cyclic-nucleotide 2'-phosphodiesterase [Shewanella algicola]